MSDCDRHIWCPQVILCPPTPPLGSGEACGDVLQRVEGGLPDSSATDDCRRAVPGSGSINPSSSPRSSSSWWVSIRTPMFKFHVWELLVRGIGGGTGFVTFCFVYSSLFLVYIEHACGISWNIISDICNLYDMLLELCNCERKWILLKETRVMFLKWNWNLWSESCDILVKCYWDVGNLWNDSWQCGICVKCHWNCHNFRSEISEMKVKLPKQKVNFVWDVSETWLWNLCDLFRKFEKWNMISDMRNLLEMIRKLCNLWNLWN